MHKGLGRGLDSLIPPKNNAATIATGIASQSSDWQRMSSIQIRDLALDCIDANPLQPRQHFDDEALEDLSHSIEEYGLLEPIVVTPNGNDRYVVVAGERRLRAHKHLRRKTIPAIIRSASELERLALALIENIQRQDLNPMEKAEGMRALVNDFGLTQEEAAKKIGVARSTLANSLRLFDLPAEMQIALKECRMTEGHAKLLLGITDVTEQVRLFQEILHGKMSVHALSHRLSVRQKKKNMQEPSRADWELQELQDRLQKIFGTKVRVQRLRNRTQITIETFSDDELRSVIATITTN